VKSSSPRPGRDARKVAAIALWLVYAAVVQSQVIGFDPPALPGDTAFVTSYAEAGFLFTTPVGFFHRDSGSDPVFPDNDTAYLAFATLMEPLVITNAAGLAFSLESVELAEYSTLLGHASIPVVGHRADGSSFSQTLILDGLQDGTGPAADFQLFTLDTAFSDLTHVELQGIGYSLDNVAVVVAQIPEPSSAAGLALGAWLLWRARRSTKD